MDPSRPAPERLPPTVPLLALAGALLQLATGPRYGLFRDEFYYLACADHLDWGYVDHPPLSIAVLWAGRALLGDSLLAVRLLPSLLLGLLVLLAALLAREYGGGRFAQGLAALSILAAPQLLGLTGIYSMNALDLAFWAGGALLVARLSRLDRPRLWLPLGLLIGLGSMNKLSMLFFAAGLGAATLLTPLRRHLRTPWPWAGALLAAVCLLPHVLWQVAHDWPTAEFVRNATLYKNTPLSPWRFLGAQVEALNPLSAPLWVGGLLWLLLARAGRAFRPLAIVYLVALGVMLLQNAKPYYLAPAAPMLLAAGATAVGAWSASGRPRHLRRVVPLLLATSGAALAPFAIPLLPVERFLAWQSALGLTPGADERHELGPLPQFFADRFGWRELAQEVARIHAGLPPDERARVLIATGNYGEAGALRYFGRELGLPPAVSQHNSFWLWGPGRETVDLAIIVGMDEDDMRAAWQQVEVAGRLQHPWAMPYEQRRPILVCRGLKLPLARAWRQGRHYI